MTPHFIPIYGTAILTLGVLAMFAGHNRKTGWTKKRSAFTQWLNDFYAGAYVDRTMSESAFRETRPSAPNWVPLTDSEVMGFSRQLLALRASLGSAGQAPAFEPAHSYATASSGHGSVRCS